MGLTRITPTVFSRRDGRWFGFPTRLNRTALKGPRQLKKFDLLYWGLSC